MYLVEECYCPGFVLGYTISQLHATTEHKASCGYPYAIQSGQGQGTAAGEGCGYIHVSAPLERRVFNITDPASKQEAGTSMYVIPVCIYS